MSLLQNWNGWAESAFSWAQSALISSSCLLLLASAVWLLVRRRTTAHVGHLLFLVPLAPLVLPSLGSCQLPAWILPARNLAGSPLEPILDETAPTESTPNFPLIEFEQAPRNAIEPAILTTERDAAPTWKALLLLLWCAGTASLLTKWLVTQYRTHQRLRSARSWKGAEQELVQERLVELSKAIGLRSAPRMVEAPELGGPAVWGMRSPVLILERKLIARLDRSQLDWVLAHELAHLSRRDPLRSALLGLVQVFWFFHPVVWFTTRVAGELRESACDEIALAITSPTRRASCATALIEVAAHEVSRSRRAPLLTLQDDKEQMKKRIQRLLDPTLSPTARPSFTGIVLCGLLASASLVEVGVAREPQATFEGEGGVALEVVTGYDRKDTLAAIDRSLSWLLKQQADDGHWPTGPRTEAESGEFNATGVTGFVLMALGSADGPAATLDLGPAIQRGRDYLRHSQRRDGLFGHESGHTFMQSHAVATLAWLKTRPQGDEEAWLPQAESAVELILRARNPYMGWRFGLQPTGDCDTFTTGLMLAALREARSARIAVPERAWREPLEYIEQLTDPESGRTGYDRRGGNDPRLIWKQEDYPAELTQLSTAMGILTREEWGEKPAFSPTIRRGSSLLNDFAPRWDEQAGSIDYYYWLFGTRALAPLGGILFEPWRAATLSALVPNQQQDGTWPSIDAWSAEGTEIHTTAICTLTLQATL